MDFEITTSKARKIVESSAIASSFGNRTFETEIEWWLRGLEREEKQTVEPLVRKLAAEYTSQLRATKKSRQTTRKIIRANTEIVEENKYRYCAKCGIENEMPFICSYCGEVFCNSHHLPENHACAGLEEDKEIMKASGRWFKDWKGARNVQGNTVSEALLPPDPGRDRLEDIFTDNKSSYRARDPPPKLIRDPDETRKHNPVVWLFLIVFLAGCVYFLYDSASGGTIISAVLSWVKLPGSMDDSPGVNPPAGVTNSQSEINITAIEAKIYNLTNIERRRAGLSPLSLNINLSNAARYQSCCLSRNRIFAHDTAQCGTLDSRLRMFNVRYPAGENILLQPNAPSYYVHGITPLAPPSFSEVQHVSRITGTPTRLYSETELATLMVDGWMGSSGHRSNILNQNYTEIGIGVCASDDQYFYATQDFIISAGCGYVGGSCCSLSGGYGCYSPASCDFADFKCKESRAGNLIDQSGGTSQVIIPNPPQPSGPKSCGNETGACYGTCPGGYWCREWHGPNGETRCGCSDQSTGEWLN